MTRRVARSPVSIPGQDAEHRLGSAWPHPRFEADAGWVLDRLTGLIWSRDAGVSEFPLAWSEALAFVRTLNRETHLGLNDWRLPNRRELRSLIDHQARRPALPAGHPFRNVFTGWYWSSTSAALAPNHARYVKRNIRPSVRRPADDTGWR